MSLVNFPLAADDRDPEKELRARFAQFWSTATGDPRTVYDTFISATPLADGVSSEQVETASVRGWWVQPSVAEHDGVLLYLHGGGTSPDQPRPIVVSPVSSPVAWKSAYSSWTIRWRRRRRCLAALDAVMAAYEWLCAIRCERISSSPGTRPVAALLWGHSPAWLTVLWPGAAIAGLLFSPWVVLAFTGASMKDASIQDPLSLTYEALQAGATMHLGGADAIRSPRRSSAICLHCHPFSSESAPTSDCWRTHASLPSESRAQDPQCASRCGRACTTCFKPTSHTSALSGVALDRAAFVADAFSNRFEVSPCQKSWY